MSTREGNSLYKDTRANDVLAELVERARQFWRERKGVTTATEITNCCNAISAVLQSWPQ